MLLTLINKKVKIAMLTLQITFNHKLTLLLLKLRIFLLIILIHYILLIFYKNKFWII